MTETDVVREHGTGRSSTTWAWIAAALTPVGIVAGIAVAYGVAAIIGVTLDPAGGPSPTVAENTLVYSIAGIVWLAAPSTAVVLAVRSVRSGDRSGIAALIVGVVLVLAMLLLTIANLVSS